MTVDLAALLADPAKLEAVPAEHLPDVIAELERLKARVLLRLSASSSHGASEDHLLTIEEAAERLRTTPDWLRHHPDLPFVVRLSAGQVRFSAHGITRWVKARMGSR